MLFSSFKAHRRDALIEFIKGLLAVPFVLHSQPTTIAGDASFGTMAVEARRRYREIMKDVEELINDHSKQYSCPSHLFVLTVSS